MDHANEVGDHHKSKGKKRVLEILLHSRNPGTEIQVSEKKKLICHQCSGKIFPNKIGYFILLLRLIWAPPPTTKVWKSARLRTVM